MDLRSIRALSQEKWLELLGDVAKEFERDGSVPPARLDAVIVVLLEISRHEWPDESALESIDDIRQALDGGELWSRVIARFLETKALADQYKKADSVDRLRLRPSLAARGLL